MLNQRIRVSHTIRIHFSGNDEDSQGKYRALSQRLDKEKLKSQRLEILELQRTVKEMEQEMKLMKCNYSGSLTFNLAF